MTPTSKTNAFRRLWDKHFSHSPGRPTTDREIQHYIDTSARVNSHLPKNIQLKKAAEMAADDYMNTGSPEGF